MSEKYMIGTKYYRTNPDSKAKVPIILRLKKQEGERLFFDLGGYDVNLTQEEFRTMITSEELVLEHNDVYTRRFEYFTIPIKQIWQRIGDITDEFVKFRVLNIGVKMSLSELKSNYIRLIPDGFFTIANITYPQSYTEEKGFDVLCTLHNKNDKFPSVICRQDVTDIFQYTESNHRIQIGLSISQRSCPKGVNFSSFLYSEGVKDFRAVAVYLEDTINSILKYVGPLNKYNATLHRLKEKYQGTKFFGGFDNIYDLLVNNGFYEDFKDLFKVTTYPFIQLDHSVMTPQETAMFNKILGTKTKSVMTNIVYCPYTRDIDLDNIQSRYLLVNSGDNKKSDIFVVTFDEQKLPV